jgi:serologically defined colon cancer antigen 8
MTSQTFNQLNLPFPIQDELSTLLTKVKDVVSENEQLTERVKFGSDAGDSYEPLMRTSKFTATSGPNILFESRISELEAQITQMNIDYKKVSDENVELKRKRALGVDPTVDISCTDAYKKQVENLQRDKASLEDMVKKLQKQITEFKSLDAQVFSKTQRNRDLVEQANFEKTTSAIEIRRLKVGGGLNCWQLLIIC